MSYESSIPPTIPPTVVEVLVGRPTQYGTTDAADPLARPWTSSIYKQPVRGPLWLGRTNLAGDAQADLENHGGPDKAVMAYSAEHYPLWRRELELPEMPWGGFGENLTIAGLDETNVCLGDVFELGDARVQVSQPRQPCWKLARRWRIKDLPARAIATGRMGWYFRVLAEGQVQVGQPITRLERPLPRWTVEAMNQVMHHRRDDVAGAAELAACELLSVSWRSALRRRIERSGDNPREV